MIACPACRAPLPAAAVGTADFVACPICPAELRVQLFPAAFKVAEVERGAAAAAAEATCFFHAEKRAAVPCDACGRYLCALCDLEVGGRHLCPACAASRASDPGADRHVRERVLWDSAALALAGYPMLIFYFTLITAPSVVYLVIRHWRSPTSLVPRTRARFVIALLIASAQIAGWIAVFGFLLVSIGRNAAG